MRERYRELRPDEEGLERTLAAGAERARAIAQPVMAEVRDAMGIGPSRRRPARLGCPPMSLATLDLDLEVFHGPFDLLLTLVLREEIDLLEVDLAEVVLAYVEHLERAGELDLEAATEFLVLIAALLELKSRLMLPQEDEEGLDLEPQEAAEELLARMLEYHRYRGAAQHLRDRLEAEHGYRYRSAPLPPRAAARVARGGRGGLRPDAAGRGARRAAGGAAAARPAPRAPARRLGRAAPGRTCASCSRAAAASPSTTPSRAPTG